MFFFFSIIKLGVLLLFFLAFSNFTEIILRFSLLNVVYFSIQAVIGKYFPSIDSKQTSLLGFGVSCVLSCFIPSMALEVFSIFVSTAGILYRVTESAQLLTITFQFSRNLKERMPNAPAFWGGLILLLTLMNIILAFCYDYSFYGAVKDNTTTEDLSLIKTLLVALVVLQIMAIAFTIIKANYDSIILNSATFGLYLSLLSFQILSKKNMFASSCSFKDHSVIGGLLNIALFERDKGFWGVTKDCLDTSFVLNLVVPAIIYYTLPATFSEWKLFWTGKREDEEREEAKQNGFVSKLVSIAFLLFGTDMLIKGDRSIPECFINLVIGSLFFVLKIFVADIYSPTKKS